LRSSVWLYPLTVPGMYQAGTCRKSRVTTVLTVRSSRRRLSVRPVSHVDRAMSNKAGIARHLCFLGGVISGLASAFLWVMYYELYWRHRHYFNSEGRYFDTTELVVYHQQSWFVAMPAILCLVVSVALAWLARRLSRLQSHRPNKPSKPTRLRGST